jgi:hypothetical protein
MSQKIELFTTTPVRTSNPTFKNAVPILQEKRKHLCVFITKTIRLMLFREVIVAHYEDHMKHITHYVGVCILLL